MQVHIVMHELGGGKSVAETAFEDEADALAIAGRGVNLHVVTLEVQPRKLREAVWINKPGM
jgi:hypothetical protein